MADKQLQVYEPGEIEAKLGELGLKEWYLEDGWLRRKYTTDGWPTTLMLVNAIGYLAEAAWHHPDLQVTWGKLWVQIETSSQVLPPRTPAPITGPSTRRPGSPRPWPESSSDGGGPVQPP